MASKLTNTARTKSKPCYALYCVNIFGSGLKTIKDEFKRQTSSGSRPNVFVLDLMDLQTKLSYQPQITKIQKDFSLMQVTLTHIQEILVDYEKQAKKITEELKFDLYEYWQKQNGVTKNFKSDKSNSVKTAKRTEIEIGKSRATDEMCSSTLIVKEHNKVGNPRLLSASQHIRDEPTIRKLYIIILGEMTKPFLMDLFRQDQPVEAIINFMPTESNYDILLGNDKLRNFISFTLDTVNNSIFNLRQENILKPVGLFNHRLPVISNCLAAKNSREIFDQLTWSIYDVDILKRQYKNYYFKPFQVTDVEIPATENIAQLYQVAKTLSAQGQFQKSSLPKSESDLASIADYLNHLLSTCGVHEDITTKKSQTNLLLPNAFSAITNICKFDKLVVAGSNSLLLNMLKYSDLHDSNAVYSCCLDYKVLGLFAISQQLESPRKFNKNDPGHAIQLPQYVKYYVNKECSWQRIAELKQEYDEYEIRKLSDCSKMYIFKRAYYVLKECESTAVIPTRLCFRDFTIFQMEEFLKDLKTPELSSAADNEAAAKDNAIDEKSIFVRLNSLKATKMLKELNEGIANRKNEFRSRKKIQTHQDSSLSKKTTSEENKGLPAGHHLLQGYNLDDTLQEVISKTSSYNFLHGCIKFYEEKWCFREMNRQLSIDVNNAILFFFVARNQDKGISNNIRLVTKDNVSIRILNADSECSRVVMNYPNGLSIYHHLNYCEQIWHCDKSPRDEQKRILTNFGAIIIFFKSQNLKILRYNGEVYKLHQHELEEENGNDIQNKISEMTESNSQKPKLRESKLSGQTSKSKLASEESKNTFSIIKSSTSNFMSSLKFELNFLNFLCSIYKLTYLRCSITTSSGKVVDVTSQGELSEKLHYSTNEWFDYFANEAFCMRSDGVKMIWSQDSFICFHEDGTVFKTTTEDLKVADKDEFESLITQSSSHKEFLEQTDESQGQSTFETQSSNCDLATTVIGEGCQLSDVPFVQFRCRDMSMQHPNYAEVFIQQPGTKSSNLEIFGLNSTRIYTHKMDNGNNFEINEDFEENKYSGNLIVNVGIHKNLKVKVNDESCEINAIITNEEKAESDSLCLCLKYTDNINDVFKSWVREIDSFKKNNEQELKELYFIEKINNDFSIRGFEFCSLLPNTSPYKHQTSNSIIELKSIDTINETILCNSKEHEEDLKKFPRFKQTRKEKYCDNTENGLPMSLSANLFIEIPQQLRNSQHITKFLEPFENIYFKRFRGKFKEALNFYLRPQQQQCLKMLRSRINWRRRIWEYERRLFNEKQRRGLYYAMIKHKTYPNYWQFTQTYGNDVRCIEFFDFVQKQCNCASD